ncbi:hypothetical protein [Marseilla massiliensis]|uniref:hypothetical protein n=1 Tax=Marseilla massiliensis TaxID=1841864 RepID=UPI0030C82FEE
MEHHCPKCGREQPHDQLCYFCREQERLAKAIALTDEEMKEKADNLKRHVKRLDAFEESETYDFASLFYVHGRTDEELQRAALKAEVYGHNEIYYHAPADVRDELIRRLMASTNSNEAGQLLACVAMQGDDVSLKALVELENNPRPWRKGLCVDPSVYAWDGGFTFDKQGNRLEVAHPECFAIETGNPDEDHAIRLGQPHEGRCRHCGCQLMDIITIDGHDPRLAFLGLDGKTSISCCPNCVQFAYPVAYAKAVPNGESHPIFPYEGVEDDEENYWTDEMNDAARANRLVLSKERKPPFYGLFFDDGNTVGGFGNWIQDCEVPTCPECGQPMKLIAQIGWSTLCNDFMEGTLYISYCNNCHMAALQHQQT